MGSGRLLGAQALAAAIVLWSGAVIAGCGSASNAAGPTAGASATATAQPTSTPSPTATPDPLDRFASSAEEARTVVAAALASDASSACPQRLQVRWKVLSAEGAL